MFGIDDAAIIAAIEAAQAAAAEQAAAAAAASAAAPAVEAVAAPAMMEVAAPAAAEAMTPELTSAATNSIAQDSISNALADIANGTAAEMSPTAAQSASTPVVDQVSSMQSAVQPAMDPGYYSPQGMDTTGSMAPPSMDAPMPAAGQSSGANLMNGMDAQELNPARAAAGPANSITDSIGRFADKAVDALTDPKNLVGSGLNLAGTAMQQSALDAEQQRQNKEHDARMAEISKESDNLNRAISGWGQEYLSADGMEHSRQQSEDDLNKTLGQMLASANKDQGGPNGAVSGDFTKAMAEGAARAGDSATTYAKLMAKAQAPAFANINSQIGALRANNDAMSAQSRINGIGAIDRATTGSINPSAGAMLGGSALQGLGSAVSKSK